MPSLGPYEGARALVTGGLGFIGSHLSKKLVELGAEVTIVDSLIPEYGGNPYNIREIADAVHVNYSDIRDPWSIRYLVKGQDFIFNLAGQVSHIDSMQDPETDLDNNWVSWMSPIAKALLNRKRSERIRFKFPSGEQELQIIDISYE